MRRLLILFAVLILSLGANRAPAINMTDYCYIPPSISGATVPPLVMLVMGRDHKLYYEAYNDASDLDGDGRLDVGYKHSIDYYGYFDPYKCYRYQGSGANAKFVPVRRTSNKYCGGTDEWSGNFLNWLTMSRIDVLRKVLYGGHRVVDSASETVLAASYIPQDAHSWGKEYEGPDTRQLTPFNPPTPGRRHLFCVVSTSANDTRKIRVALNDPNRIWQWASTERAVCSGPDTPPGVRRDPVGTRSDITDYYIRVKVCDPTVGLEENCKQYPAGTYKPIGLLQKYGENEGGGKWCSKSLKSCNSDSDCNITTDGLCVDRAKMYFGLLTGSYTKNLSGGVLRKNIWTIQDEIDPNTGIFRNSINAPGNIILTLDRMTVVGFTYSDFSYQDTSVGSCGWITDAPLSEGQCRMWGNPLAEMMYEAVRYLAGKGSPTPSFTYSGSQDSGLDLPKPDWGIRRGSNTYQPYQIFPICAKPFMVVFSDINPSYDSDSLPGSSFGGISGDLVGLNVSSLANTISTNEGISGNYFIGQSGSFYDFICSPKNVTSFSNIRGLCPEEPTKQGSYYSASIAYYGNISFNNNFTGRTPPNIKTYAVALASPIPDIAIKVGNKTVRIVPFAKSVSGCFGVYQNCDQRCTLTRDASGRLIISGCASNAFCPTNQIVDFYVEQVNYDASNNLTYAKFRINFEDVEQGADHDMDAVVIYEITPVGTNQVNVRVTSEYAAGCLDQVLGFFISGTTEDGQWLVVRDSDAYTDSDTPSIVGSMPTTWQRTFTLSGTAAGQLKDPLWYASKWGGFDDQNGNNVPDIPSEWDKDGDGSPDTYFYVINPLKMEQQLEKAFSDILRRASSGATVATLTSRRSASSVVVQPYSYTEYRAPDGRKVSWIGFLRDFWIDASQQLREDSSLDRILQLLGTFRDKIIQFLFDPDTQETKVILRDPEAGTCSASFAGSRRLGEINYLLMHDCALANLQSASDRKIYYRRYGNFREFSTSNWNELKDVWNQVDGTIADYNEVERIINYLRGEYDYTYLSGTDADRYTARKRQFDNSAICPGYSVISSNPPPWKLGFINASTPSVAGNVPLLDKWVFIYGDASYRNFVSSPGYKDRRFVSIVGTYDGMLHFFRIGKLRETGDTWAPVRLDEDEDGKEEYAIIPENALPYMLWYGREDYCPVPIIDYRSQVVDLPLNGGSGSPLSENSWRTYLIGVMGFGGKRLEGKDFSSSVFMLDLTNYLGNSSNPPPPEFVFEMKLLNYELTTSFPVVVRQLTDTSSPEKNGKFYLILGSGPLDPYADSKDKFTDNPRLYVIQLSDGINPYFKQFTLNNLPELPGTERKFAVGDLVVLDLDNDKRDDVIYFGVYGFYKQGSNWKWFGGLYRLAFKIEPTNPWDRSYKEISELSEPDIKPVIVLADNNFSGPVFGRPSATLDEQGNLWVYFATGIYTSPEHKNSPWGDNYIFGIKDPCWDPANRWFRRSCSHVSRADLKDQTNVDLQYSSVVEQETICTCDLTGCGEQTVVRRVVPTNFNDILNDMTSYKGWYVNIGKRLSYSTVQVFGGYVYAMATEFPETQDICQQTPKTRLYALYYLTGTGAPNVGILMPGIAGGGRVEKSVDLGFGSAPFGPVLQVARSSSGELLAVFQTSVGAIQKVRLQSAHAGQLRRILWIEK